MIQATSVLHYAVPEKLNLPVKFKDPATIIMRSDIRVTAIRHALPSIPQMGSTILTSSA